MTLRTARAYCANPACRRAVVWLASERTGIVAPIDATTSPDGSVEVDEEAGTYRMVPEAERKGRMLHRRHWATCGPNR